MALNIETQYPGKSNAADADYPFGSARNISIPGDGTGTPLEEAWLNDLFGLQQALLSRTGITPSGLPDTSAVSQYLQALVQLFPATYGDLSTELLGDDSIAVGDFVATRGYHAAGDGGANAYRAWPQGTAPAYDGGKWIYHPGSDVDLEGLFLDGNVNIVQFGAQEGIVSQAAHNAAAYSLTVFFPPVDTFWAVDEPVYMRNGQTFVGDGPRSHLRNIRGNQSPYSAQFALFLGNVDGGGFTAATSYGVGNATAGDYSVALDSPGDDVNFNVGDIVAVYSSEGTIIGTLKPDFQMINEVVGVSAGTVSFRYPFQEDFTSADGRMANMNATGNTDFLGNPVEMVKDITLKGMKVSTSVEKWTGFGGMLRATIEDCEFESQYVFSVNGVAHSKISGVDGFFSRGGFEIAYFSQDTNISDSDVTYFEDAVGVYGPLYNTVEQTRRVQFEGCRGSGGGLYTPIAGVSLNSSRSCKFTNGEIFVEAPISAVGEIVAETVQGSDNEISNSKLSCRISNNYMRITQTTGQSDRNRLHGNECFGEVTSALVRVQSGEENTVSHNRLQFSGFDIVVLADATGTELLHNRGAGGVSDSGVATKEIGNFRGPVPAALNTGGTYRFTLDDDEAIAIPILTPEGFVEVITGFATVNYSSFAYRLNPEAVVDISLGANWESSTGVLNGTTGTDGVLTFSPSSDGSLYVENRTGVTATVKMAVK